MLDREQPIKLTKRQALALMGGAATALLAGCGSSATAEQKPAGVATLPPVGQKPEATAATIATAVTRATAAAKPTETRTAPTVVPTATKAAENSTNPLVQLFTGTTEISRPEKVTVMIGESKLVFFAGGVASYPGGYFYADDVFEEVAGKQYGPMSRIAFSPSSSRLDVISVDYALPTENVFKPLSHTEVYRTRDGSKKDFIAKMVVARHQRNEIKFHEYAVGSESWGGERANDTPLHPDYNWYAGMKDLWAIEGEGSERFVRSLGARTLRLADGNTEEGNIAMIFKKYKFSAQ